MSNRGGPAVLCLVAIFCGICALLQPAHAQSRLYIATNGNDAWSGTRPAPNRAGTDGPFATLERARDAIRALKQANRYPARGVLVELRAGTYSLNKTFKLEKEDSGTERGPVVYRAYRREPVRLVGGKRVTGFVPVTDPAILRRLPPEAHEHVLQTDLQAQGITDLGTLKPYGTRWPRDGAAPPELFFNGQRMTLARWPNEGFALIGELPDPKNARHTWRYEGDRPERWVNETDVWLHGYFTFDYSDVYRAIEKLDTTNRTITVARYWDVAWKGRCKEGHRYYALNLLPELDRPGEYYLDRSTGILYFWPPARLEQGETMVSTLHNVARLKKTEYVALDHLTIEFARSDAVQIRDGRHNRVVGCTLRNTGQDGVRIRGGQDNGVLGCDVYDTGESGIVLEGGDRKTLTPARHYAENNHIHRYARRKRTYRPAVAFKGVGCRASHNLIHNAPHCAVLGGGNDHLMEFNEIHNIAQEAGDVGAYYTYCNWTTRGNVVRHNFFHHIRAPGSSGSYVVYLDCGPSGTTIYGNVFHKLWKRAIWIGGGRDNTVENNIFVDCRLGVQIKAVVANPRYRNHSEEGGTLRRNLAAVPYTKPPWSTRYPQLVNILEDDYRLPKGNVVTRNISVGGKWIDMDKKSKALVQIRDNLVDEDPRFVDAANMNFQLRSDSSAFRRIGFKRIPFEKIGLYKSAQRASWPVEHPILELPVPLSERSGKKPRPVFKVVRLAAAPQIDGVPRPSEWAGREPAKAMLLERIPNGKKVSPRSLAWLGYDDSALYLALENEVSSSAPLGINTTQHTKFAFNLTVRKTATRQWVMWQGTGGNTFEVGRAGFIELD